MGKGKKNKKDKAPKLSLSSSSQIQAIVFNAPEDRTKSDQVPKLIPPNTFQTISDILLQTVPPHRNVFLSMCEYRIQDVNPLHKETSENPTHMIIFCLRLIMTDEFHPIGVVQIDKRIDQTKKLVCVWKTFLQDLSILRLIVIGSISPPSIIYHRVLSELTQIPNMEDYTGPITYSVWPYKDIVHLYDYYCLLHGTQEALFDHNEVCFMACLPSAKNSSAPQLWTASWTDILLVLISRGITCFYTSEDKNLTHVAIFSLDFWQIYQQAREDGLLDTDSKESTHRLMELLCPFITLLHSNKPYMCPGDLQLFYDSNEELRILLATAQFKKLRLREISKIMPRKKMLNTHSTPQCATALKDPPLFTENSLDRDLKKKSPFDIFLQKVTYDDYDMFLKTSSTTRPRRNEPDIPKMVEVVFHDHDYFKKKSPEKPSPIQPTTSIIHNLVKDYFGEAVEQFKKAGQKSERKMANSGKKLYHESEEAKKAENKLILDVETPLNGQNSTDIYGTAESVQQHSDNCFQPRKPLESPDGQLDSAKPNLNLAAIYQEDKLPKAFLKSGKSSHNFKVRDNIESIKHEKTSNIKASKIGQLVYNRRGGGKKLKAKRLRYRENTQKLLSNLLLILNKNSPEKPGSRPPNNKNTEADKSGFQEENITVLTKIEALIKIITSSIASSENKKTDNSKTFTDAQVRPLVDNSNFCETKVQNDLIKKTDEAHLKLSPKKYENESNNLHKTVEPTKTDSVNNKEVIKGRNYSEIYTTVKQPSIATLKTEPVQVALAKNKTRATLGSQCPITSSNCISSTDRNDDTAPKESDDSNVNTVEIKAESGEKASKRLVEHVRNNSFDKMNGSKHSANSENEVPPLTVAFNTDTKNLIKKDKDLKMSDSDSADSLTELLSSIEAEPGLTKIPCKYTIPKITNVPVKHCLKKSSHSEFVTSPLNRYDDSESRFVDASGDFLTSNSLRDLHDSSTMNNPADIVTQELFHYMMEKKSLELSRTNLEPTIVDQTLKILDKTIDSYSSRDFVGNVLEKNFILNEYMDNQSDRNASPPLSTTDSLNEFESDVTDNLTNFVANAALHDDISSMFTSTRNCFKNLDNDVKQLDSNYFTPVDDEDSMPDLEESFLAGANSSYRSKFLNSKIDEESLLKLTSRRSYQSVVEPTTKDSKTQKLDYFRNELGSFFKNLKEISTLLENDQNNQALIQHHAEERTDYKSKELMSCCMIASTSCNDHSPFSEVNNQTFLPYYTRFKKSPRSKHGSGSTSSSASGINPVRSKESSEDDKLNNTSTAENIDVTIDKSTAINDPVVDEPNANETMDFIGYYKSLEDTTSPSIDEPFDVNIKDEYNPDEPNELNKTSTAENIDVTIDKSTAINDPVVDEPNANETMDFIGYYKSLEDTTSPSIDEPFDVNIKDEYNPDEPNELNKTSTAENIDVTIDKSTAINDPVVDEPNANETMDFIGYYKSLEDTVSPSIDERIDVNIKDEYNPDEPNELNKTSTAENIDVTAINDPVVDEPNANEVMDFIGYYKSLEDTVSPSIDEPIDVNIKDEYNPDEPNDYVDYKEYKKSLEACDNQESKCDIIYKDRNTYERLYSRIPDDFKSLRLTTDWLCTFKGYIKLKEVLETRKVRRIQANALSLEHIDFFVHLIKKGRNNAPSVYQGKSYRFLDYKCAFDMLSLGKGVFLIRNDEDINNMSL